MFSSCKNEFQVKGLQNRVMPQHDLLMPRHVPKHQNPYIFPRATCRSMTPSCRGMPPQGRKVNVLHAAAWPRILKKIKPHDLSLFSTLLNPISSTQTLKFFPTFNPLTLANFNQTKSQILHIPSQHQPLFNLILQDWENSLKNWKLWKS